MLMNKKVVTVVVGLASGTCALPASAGWLDAVNKVVETANRVTNAVEAVKAIPEGNKTETTTAAAAVKTEEKTAVAEATTAEAKTDAKVETKAEETKTETKTDAAAAGSTRLALSEEEAEDIANGQPISMDMDDLAARMKASSDYVLIDVRKPMEYKKGHIKGAKNVPFDDVSNSMPKPCADKDKPIYLYCLSGDRAIAAGQYLIKNGYKRVYNCGGIDDWNGKLVK